jgi:hypothetical protein
LSFILSLLHRERGDPARKEAVCPIRPAHWAF